MAFLILAVLVSCNFLIIIVLSENNPATQNANGIFTLIIMVRVQERKNSQAAVNQEKWKTSLQIYVGWPVE